jgi:hypothetical protein
VIAPSVAASTFLGRVLARFRVRYVRSKKFIQLSWWVSRPRSGQIPLCETATK